MREGASDHDPRMLPHDLQRAADVVDLVALAADAIAELGDGDRVVADDGVDGVDVLRELGEARGDGAVAAVVDVRRDDVDLAVLACGQERLVERRESAQLADGGAPRRSWGCSSMPARRLGRADICAAAA